MNEFELIERLVRSLPVNKSVVVGPGDDCAVLDLGLADRLLLLKTDAIVEGVHFTAAAPAEKIGHKALARCLSDTAAMAGAPTAAAAKLNGTSYSQLISGLKKAGIELDRKILADIAVHDAAGFTRLVEQAKAALASAKAA